MELLAVLSSLLFFGVPIYYVALVMRGWGGKSRVPVWAASTCLGLWVLQLPFMAALGLGCAGGGCAGTRATMAGLVFLVLFDVAPLVWLTRRFSKRGDSPKIDARDPLRVADEARGFPAGYNPRAEAGSLSRADPDRRTPR